MYNLNDIDVNNINFKQRRSFHYNLKLLSKFNNIAARYYPETVGKSFINYAPSFINRAWAIIKSILDPNTVKTVEIIKGLSESAQSNLKNLEIENVYYRCGDGWKGWLEFAPFDKIIVTAAPPVIPSELIEQLGEGGILVIPVGGEHETQTMVVGVKENGFFKKTDEISVRFVPLVKGGNF